MDRRGLSDHRSGEAERELNASEGVRNPGEGEKLVKKQRDAVNDEKRWQTDRNRCSGSALGPGDGVADVGGAVDCYRARRGLCDGNHIQEVVAADPFLFFDKLTCEERDHCVAAAKGKSANLKKRQKKCADFVHKNLDSGK